MRPSPVLLKRRFAFTTKQVGKGFYRGTGTGATGAHTEYGGYIIDYRKVRHFYVPEDLSSCNLTPFVTHQMEPTQNLEKDDGTGMRYQPKSWDGMTYIREWKETNPDEYERLRDMQREYREEVGRLQRWQQEGVFDRVMQQESATTQHEALDASPEQEREPVRIESHRTSESTKSPS